MIFITLASRRIRLPEDDTDASKHVEVLRIYEILFIYIYMYMYVCILCIYIYMYVCCTFVGLDNKLYKMHGTYIKM